MVECLVWDQDAAGSSPVTSTIKTPNQVNRLGSVFLHLQIRQDLNLMKALSVEQNSPVDCFVAKRCEDGHRMRKH